jgi:hypothetical protein
MNNGRRIFSTSLRVKPRNRIRTVGSQNDQKVEGDGREVFMRNKHAQPDARELLYHPATLTRSKRGITYRDVMPRCHSPMAQ